MWTNLKNSRFRPKSKIKCVKEQWNSLKVFYIFSNYFYTKYKIISIFKNVMLLLCFGKFKIIYNRKNHFNYRFSSKKILGSKISGHIRVWKNSYDGQIVFDMHLKNNTTRFSTVSVIVCMRIYFHYRVINWKNMITLI